MSDFDAKAVAAELRAQSVIRRKKRYQRSELDKFRAELLMLRNEGLSATELQRWLHSKRTKVALSTVTRWLHKQAPGEESR